MSGAALQLTADRVAQAVVASARVFGEDPLRAIGSTDKRYRRVLTAAGVGLAQATGQPQDAAGRVLGLSPTSILNAQRRARDVFWVAASAAELAVSKLAPPPPAPRRTLTPAAVRREVRTLLHTDNATPPEIALATGLREAAIRSALLELYDMGDIRPDPMTVEGWRAQTWRWVPRSAS